MPAPSSDVSVQNKCRYEQAEKGTLRDEQEGSGDARERDYTTWRTGLEVTPRHCAQLGTNKLHEPTRGTRELRRAGKESQLKLRRVRRVFAIARTAGATLLCMGMKVCLLQEVCV